MSPGASSAWISSGPPPHRKRSAGRIPALPVCRYHSGIALFAVCWYPLDRAEPCTILPFMTGPDRSAGFQPAVLGASRPQFGSVTIRDRGYLPHWEAEGACYFITFRLADSLPSAVSQAMHAERQLLATSAARRDLLEVERRRAQKLSSRRLEALLDEGSGSCPLRNPAVAEIVSNALRFWKDKRYRLLAWTLPAPLPATRW